MNNGMKAFEEHLQRKNILDHGGRIKCPRCTEGYIIKMADDVYMCEKCKCGITFRFPLDVQ